MNNILYFHKKRRSKTISTKVDGIAAGLGLGSSLHVGVGVAEGAGEHKLVARRARPVPSSTATTSLPRRKRGSAVSTSSARLLWHCPAHSLRDLSVDVFANLLCRGVGLLLALLFRNLCTLLLRYVLAVSVGHLHQFLLLNILTGVICVLLACAWNLNPLLASVSILLPTRLTISLLLATALCLCVRLRLLTVLLGAHLFVNSLTGILVDCLTGLSELLNLLLVTLLLYLLDVLRVPDRLLCGDARDLTWRLNERGSFRGLDWRGRPVLRLSKK